MESIQLRYLSPIRFLNYHGLTDLDDFTIAQGQELETKCKDVIIKAFQENGSGIISIDGYEYTPEIINDMFSFGDFTFCIKSHLKIWNTPLLLKILETGHVRGYDGLWSLVQMHSKIFPNASFLEKWTTVTWNDFMNVLPNSVDHMKTDLYTKIVLTIIATVLVINLVKDFNWVSAAQASEKVALKSQRSLLPIMKES